MFGPSSSSKLLTLLALREWPQSEKLPLTPQVGIVSRMILNPASAIADVGTLFAAFCAFLFVLHRQYAVARFELAQCIFSVVLVAAIDIVADTGGMDIHSNSAALILCIRAAVNLFFSASVLYFGIVLFQFWDDETVQSSLAELVFGAVFAVPTLALNVTAINNSGFYHTVLILAEILPTVLLCAFVFSQVFLIFIRLTEVERPIVSLAFFGALVLAEFFIEHAGNVWIYKSSLGLFDSSYVSTFLRTFMIVALVYYWCIVTEEDFDLGMEIIPLKSRKMTGSVVSDMLTPPDATHAKHPQRKLENQSKGLIYNSFITQYELGNAAYCMKTKNNDSSLDLQSLFGNGVGPFSPDVCENPFICDDVLHSDDRKTNFAELNTITEENYTAERPESRKSDLAVSRDSKLWDVKKKRENIYFDREGRQISQEEIISTQIRNKPENYREAAIFKLEHHREFGRKKSTKFEFLDELHFTSFKDDITF